MSDEWRRNGIVYKPSEKTTSDNYLAALPMLLSGRARLLDHETLRKQLAGLERRVHTNGRESVSHGTEASAHDDVAACVAGALVLAGKPQQKIRTWVAPSLTGAPGKTFEIDPRTKRPIERPRSPVVFRNVDEDDNIIKESYHVPY